MESAFPRFTSHANLGLYTWAPGPASNQRLKPFSQVTVVDITSRIDLADAKEDSGLDTMLNNLSIAQGPPPLNIPKGGPVDFRSNLPAQNYPNGFPNEPGYVVPLCVAVRRGMALDDIDFVLGGSGLEVLAHKRIERRAGDERLAWRLHGG